MPQGVYERNPELVRSYTEAEPGVESRQEYTNRYIAEYQRAWGSKVTWHNLIAVFRSAGKEYDRLTERAA